MPGTDAKLLIDQAIAEGRHSTTWRTVCDGCRQWVAGIYHTTLDKKRLCRGCYEKLNPSTDLANAVSRSSRGERNGGVRPSPADAALPKGQPQSHGPPSQGGRQSTADARTGTLTTSRGADMTPRPAAAPTSTVACPDLHPEAAR